MSRACRMLTNWSIERSAKRLVSAQIATISPLLTGMILTIPSEAERVRILVIEDEQKIARALAEGLESAGYDVAVANTGEDGFFLTTIYGLRHKVMGPETLRKARLELKAGEAVDTDELGDQLAGLGYRPSGVVEQPGDMAIRGGLIDIFSPAHSLPTPKSTPTSASAPSPPSASSAPPIKTPPSSRPLKNKAAA